MPGQLAAGKPGASAGSVDVLLYFESIVLVGLAAHAVDAALMGQINPFLGAIPLIPTRSVAERVRQSRADSKNLPGDEAADHVVEDPDAVVSISEEHSHQSPGEQHRQEEEPEEQDEEDGPARLDVKA